MTKIEPLRDGHGRFIRDVRVSVTDRCNFRCQYCMPAEGLPWLERDQVLSFEEIERLVRVLASMGVCDIRLTGGEPLVRRDFPRLAGMLAAVDGVADLSVTTNGFLLERDAEALVKAGINRFNVSVDSLQRDRFFEMTRRDALPRVLRGLEALAQFPDAHPIKINAVGMRDFTETEILPFAEFARDAPLRGALHRVHAAGRRPPVGPEPRADRRRDPRRDRRGLSARGASRASRARPRASTASRTARARSASSTRCPSRSAATATASA